MSSTIAQKQIHNFNINQNPTSDLIEFSIQKKGKKFYAVAQQMQTNGVDLKKPKVLEKVQMEKDADGNYTANLNLKADVPIATRKGPLFDSAKDDVMVQAHYNPSTTAAPSLKVSARIADGISQNHIEDAVALAFNLPSNPSAVQNYNSDEKTEISIANPVYIDEALASETNEPLPQNPYNSIDEEFVVVDANNPKNPEKQMGYNKTPEPVKGEINLPRINPFKDADLKSYMINIDARCETTGDTTVCGELLKISNGENGKRQYLIEFAY